MEDKIIEYARKIAQYQQYPRLEHGLQPLEDYEVDGKQYPGLRTKYDREWLELQEAYASWQQQTGKTRWHVLHEAADVFYYTRQIEEQSGRSLWPGTLAPLRNYGLKAREIQTAADAKYGWRSAGKGNKDEAHEIALIQQAVEALPGPGRPPEYEGSMTRLELRVPETLKKALIRAVRYLRIHEDQDISLNAFVIERMSQDPLVQKMLKQGENE